MPIVNHAPTAIRLAAVAPAANAAGAVAENAAGAIIGTLSVVDQDVGDSVSYRVSDSRFEVAAGGVLRLRAGIALDYEAARFLTLTVTATDSGGLSKAQAFGIAVTNVNEAPTAIRLTGGRVAENLAGATIGTLATTDPDAGDRFAYTISDSRFEVIGGTLKLKAGIALNHEAAASVALSVTSTDLGGLSVTKAFTVKVGDANDIAVIAGTATGAVMKNVTLAAGGTLTVADEDAGQAGFRAPASLAGTHGSFGFNAATGAWTYTLDNADAGVQALTPGQTLTDRLTITSLDGSASQEIIITVSGGREPLAAFSIAGLAARGAGFAITGVSVFDLLGCSVAAVPDRNGDGKAEILLGAYGLDTYGDASGGGYLIYGAARSSDLALADLTPDLGFRLDGTQDGGIAGVTVAAAGDVNGDGVPDLAFSATHYDGGDYDSGAVMVYFGGNATGPATLGAPGSGYLIVGDQYEEYAGIDIASLGDLNGDGKADLLVGVPDIGDTNYKGGGAFVVWGKADDGTINLGDLSGNSSLGYRIRGYGYDARPGAGVAAIGDVNGDGLPDMALGSPGDERVYVVYGKTTPGEISLPDVANGIGGYVIQHAYGNALGKAIATVPDLNGDGKPELMISADGAGAAAGAVYVVMSQAGNAPVDLAAIAAGTGGGAGFAIIGENPGDTLGYESIAAVPDLNGDGLPDLLVGAGGNDQAAQDAGAAYLVWGKADGTPVHLADVALGHGGLKIMGEARNNGLGREVGWLPDLNGDGRPELLLGAPANSPGGQFFAGAAYVVYSSPDWIGLS